LRINVASLPVGKQRRLCICFCGFNISILGGLFALLFRHLLGPVTAGMAKQRRFLAVTLSLLAIGFYTLLVRAGASVVRAAIMGGLALFVRQVGRQLDGLTATAGSS
jgi:competence protein ComEC